MSVETPRVLVVEDDASMRSILRFNLEAEGLVVELASRGDEALARLPPGSKRAPFDLVLTDVKMPGADGMAVLRAARACHEDVQVILVTAHGTVEDAVDAMAQGAADYVTKPFRRAELKARIAQTLERAALHRENRELRAAPALETNPIIVTQSPSMLEALRVIDRVAQAGVTVLITGESGTGKDLVARRVHEKSGRPGAYVPVNCAALPAALLESELFGHERGAFTGALRRHQGRYEQAHLGTLFLDEIAELPLELQAKLLRVIEEGVVDRVGAEGRVNVDVRVVVATNRDIAAEVEAGRFREDLFHRLCVIPVRLPPLRERAADIPMLVQHLLRDVSAPGVVLAPKLLDALVERPWPGNIRELKNTIARMVLLRRSDFLDIGDLAAPGAAPHGTRTSEPPAGNGSAARSPCSETVLRPGHLVLPDAPFSLHELEREIVEKALERHSGNKSATARYLGIPRHILLYRLEKYSERAAGVDDGEPVD